MYLVLSEQSMGVPLRGPFILTLTGHECTCASFGI